GFRIFEEEEEKKRTMHGLFLEVTYPRDPYIYVMTSQDTHYEVFNIFKSFIKRSENFKDGWAMYNRKVIDMARLYYHHQILLISIYNRTHDIIDRYGATEAAARDAWSTFWGLLQLGSHCDIDERLHSRWGHVAIQTPHNFLHRGPDIM
ncbi:hypothetical protein ACJX0J_026975, partial [Zea mays]